MGGGQAEAVSYEFTIPADRNVYSLLYYYAVVFQDPNHQEYEQPRMEIEITNVTDNVRINCASFSFIPFGTVLPGFFQSPNPIDNTPIWCKDWSPVSINLDGHAGKTIRLLFRTGDCTFRRHFGYAYIDVDTDCSGEFIGASFCPDDASISVTAPAGFENYRWLNSARTQELGRGQSLTIQPPPPSGTTVAVELTPYQGYGCPQTLTARLLSNLNFTADAGPDTLSCNLAPVRIGSVPRPGLVYSWSPSESLSNPATSNPFAVPKTNTHYVLTVRSPGGGCNDTDTVFVKSSNLANSLSVEGRPEYCIGNGDSAVLVVYPAEIVQWYKDLQPVPGENGFRHRATVTGDYYAYLEDEYGCKATTNTVNINISSVPEAMFGVNNPDQCLIGNRFVFTNASTSTIGTMVYRWDLGGNQVAQGRDATLSYTEPGKYLVKLKVNTNQVCVDSTEIAINVFANPVPEFEGEAICIGLPFMPKNKTYDSIGSPVSYTWTYGSDQAFTTRDPSAVVFTNPGAVNVSLSVSSEQCPLPVQTISKSIDVQSPAAARRYTAAFAIRNAPLTLEARNIGIKALWEPAFQLSDPLVYNPVFKGNLDKEYTITLLTNGGCVTVDTVLVQIVDHAEIYVPTGFTPNGDGLNDNLRPVLMGIKELRYFRIFNRWGQVVYESRSDKTGWDGLIKGNPQSTQTFTWMAEGIGLDGTTVTRKGYSLLIR